MVTWIVAAGVGGALVLWLAARDPGPPGPPPPALRARLEAELQEALAAGRKFDAIKVYRRLHGTDLKHSKDAIERELADRSRGTAA
jgi:ribosomal protein L7/L12